MFLSFVVEKMVSRSLLRTSGDVSYQRQVLSATSWFAPHERRCFFVRREHCGESVVCSARAEMFLTPGQKYQEYQGLLRTSGDVSHLFTSCIAFKMFAPHERRCFFQNIFKNT